MKVVLVNGSPHEKGCTYTGLRGGATATFDQPNKYFTISQMPVVMTNFIR